ncbi:hypothetical protein DPEC_G00351300 [Dallia pectoralis]|uniref:Uncharacterized protein n=1 Tax=Dallia pectoralis TaxID=75939 RepID=A0ACC2F1Y1_DALPE|nr:hypothetical protein DPEC_G00351300 [Dallia pectoralis]
MEFIFGEELETTIFKSQNTKIQLTQPVKATIITGMCEGLLHLHSQYIVHQDLKPDNIMIEHETHRAVIIDMGLAKFSRYGLSSAMDMGNEAYSPPEVLQRTSPRDQRSDVWAMGKIIAELCARVRLHTPSVCPEKIQETLSRQGQQYCKAVCRMVQKNPKMRATMAEVIPEIRKANDSGCNTRGQQTNIQKALPQMEDSMWIITMEFIFGEELETTIFKSQQSKIQLTQPVKATIITGMCEGLLHLHSKDIVHQDLKPDNIMIEHETHRAVIIDMGLAKFSRYGLSSAMDMGNEAYSPPEVLQRTSPRDQRSDVWAMGFEHKNPERPEIKLLERAPVRASTPSRFERVAWLTTEVQTDVQTTVPDGKKN